MPDDFIFKGSVLHAQWVKDVSVTERFFDNLSC